MTSQPHQELKRVIQVLKDQLGIRWKQVARELNFSPTDIDAIIVRDNHDLKEQIHSFFHQWRQREGNGATVQQLLDAVKAAGLQCIIDEHYRSSQELDCSGTPTTPLQESSAAAAGIPVTPTSNPELEHIRKKRLEKLMSSDSNKSPTTPKLESADSTTSEGTTTASGTVPTSETNIASPTAKKNSTGSRFEVDSLVKVEREGKPWYGVIKWMGRIPDLSEAMFAGIQMDEEVKGGHSGEFRGTRYFICESGHGVILPTSQLKRDDRFDPPTLKTGPTPAGEDAERDDQMPSVSPHTPPSHKATSPKFGPKQIPVFPTKESSEVPTVSKVESIDGVTASSGGALFFVCPGDVAGFVIGKDGKNRREVESKTNTKICVERNERDKTANTKVLIQGDEENCQRALLLIVQNIRRKTALHTATTKTITIPNQHCGRVIGKGGANVKEIQSLTGTRINVKGRQGWDAILNPEEPATCEITGSSEQIEEAKKLIAKAVEGEDVAQNAFFAAFISALVQELKAEGYTFN